MTRRLGLVRKGRVIGSEAPREAENSVYSKILSPDPLICEVKPSGFYSGKPPEDLTEVLATLETRAPLGIVVNMGEVTNADTQFYDLFKAYNRGGTHYPVIQVAFTHMDILVSSVFEVLNERYQYHAYASAEKAVEEMKKNIPSRSDSVSVTTPGAAIYSMNHMGS